MLQLFRDALQDGYRRHGAAGLLDAWARALLDLAISVPREHVAAITERRAQLRPALAPVASGQLGVGPASIAIRRAIRDDLENGALLMSGFVVQSSLWLWRGSLSALLDGGFFALVPILGVLLLVLLLIIARLLLRVHWLQRTPPDTAIALIEGQPALPNSWWLAILIMGGMYIVGVLLIPALVAHTSDLHNAMMYQWGWLGRLYYVLTSGMVFATAFLIVPFSIALLLKVCWRWREMPGRARQIWLIVSALLLLVLALTWPSAQRFIVWWGD
jgi:hypothetical protein